MHGYGHIIKEYKTLKSKKLMCKGCRNDFYNGNNHLDIEYCFCFINSKVVDKEGPATIHSFPNENGIFDDCKMKKTLSCWHNIIR